MLLHDARRETRVDEAGDVVLLEDQDRTRWDRAQIAEGVALAESALKDGGARPYALQAAIGLRLLDGLDDALADYHLLPAARADLLRRLARWSDAAAEYRRALALTPSAAERRFLTRRLAEMEARR